MPGDLKKGASQLAWDAKQATYRHSQELLSLTGEERGEVGSCVRRVVITRVVLQRKQVKIKVGRELEGGLFIFCHRLGPHLHTHTHRATDVTQVELARVRM